LVRAAALRRLRRPTFERANPRTSRSRADLTESREDEN
jgi:hypothetical protein